MELRDLEIFRTVARTGSMTRAAQELGYVQSHITGRVRLLEKEFRRPLFERTKKGVLLTTEGQALLPHVERLLVQWEQTRTLLTQSDEPEGPLRIGSLETTAMLHAARWLAEYHRCHPKVELSLRTGTTDELVELVADHRLDAAFVAGPVERRNLATRPAIVEELQVVTAAGRTTDDELRDGPVVIAFRAGCTYRRVLEGWLAQQGAAASQTMECGSIDTILQLVAGGLGISIMPRAVLERSPMRGSLTVHCLPGNVGAVTTHVVWRDTGVLPHPLSALLQQLRGPADQTRSRSRRRTA